MRGNVANPQGARTLNKTLETAETSGHLQLANRRLKEIRDLIFKHNLRNLTCVDLSRNRLSEIPPELLDWPCLHTLDISYNVLKAIPELISELRLLEIVILSHNQLTVLPEQICDLRFIKILKLSGNRLISLPEEICKLKNCQELDVSVNELTSIPKEIVQMSSLLYLNIRRNNIHALPEDICQMKLTHLDAACNLITTIPISFQSMASLQSLVLDNNPLSFPRLPILRKGRVHLFRELEIQAERAQIKKEVMDDPRIMSPLKRSNSAIRAEFLQMKSHSLSMGETEPRAEEERLEKATELLKDRRKASVTSISSNNTAGTTEKKVPSPKKRELIAAPKRQMSSDNLPTRKPKPPPKTVTPKERKRSASSGNFERKPSSETLLIHQKLSAFPGYKPNVNERTAVSSNKKETESKASSIQNIPAKSSAPTTAKKGYMPTAIKPRSGKSRGGSFNMGVDKDSQFTMRRKTEKLYEELELMENLRQSVEARLKTQLGDEVPAALSDGVILCRLANHVRPRSIAMVHVPSPAVPKLNLAKRRRNIDSFLDACSKIGVPSANICSAQDILLEKNTAKVATTVKELLKFSPNPSQSPKRQAETPTVRVTASILGKQHSAV